MRRDPNHSYRHGLVCCERNAGITASVSEQDRAVCLGVGMDSFLSKPIKREHLLRILREWTAGPDKAD